MFTLIIFIIVLSILVFVHELGHFIIAKRAGMKVEEFGFGFPPRLFGIRRGETIYSLNWIPFGGFVKIFGEDGQEQDNPRSFASAKTRTRAGVLVAGVVMNILLAVVLLSIGNAVGLRIGLAGDTANLRASDIKVQIIQVAAGSPAEKAGLNPLDEIIGFKVGATVVTVSSVEEVQDFINKNIGSNVIALIREGESIIEKNLVPRSDPPLGEGATGVSLAVTGIVRYPWYEAIGRGAMDTVNIF
ncbi:MAG: site-2 protease family protein, partial [Patescibacteria group bacterium]